MIKAAPAISRAIGTRKRRRRLFTIFSGVEVGDEKPDVGDIDNPIIIKIKPREGWV